MATLRAIYMDLATEKEKVLSAKQLSEEEFSVHAGVDEQSQLLFLKTRVCACRLPIGSIADWSEFCRPGTDRKGRGMARLHEQAVEKRQSDWLIRNKIE
jgi:hypothetical protein